MTDAALGHLSTRFENDGRHVHAPSSPSVPTLLLARQRQLEPLLRAEHVVGVLRRGIDVDLHPLDRAAERVPAWVVYESKLL
jgi:hypothetical protein